jgi:hypothetical protein
MGSPGRTRRIRKTAVRRMISIGMASSMRATMYAASERPPAIPESEGTLLQVKKV